MMSIGENTMSRSGEINVLLLVYPYVFVRNNGQLGVKDSMVT